VGYTSEKKVNKTSYVLCHQSKSFDWRVRRAKPHPLGLMNDSFSSQVCDRLNQIIQPT
jgi:mRNA interferase MazF